MFKIGLGSSFFAFEMYFVLTTDFIVMYNYANKIIKSNQNIFFSDSIVVPQWTQRKKEENIMITLCEVTLSLYFFLVCR